jgi:hypothetical protein
MKKLFLARSVTAFVCALAIGVGASYALTATTPESIRGQLTQALGAPAGSLEVTSSAYLLTILRINTALNDTTHSRRSQEAERIARTVSEAIKGLPNGPKIVGINVEYVKRAGAGRRDRLVDRVELRKNPDGTFTVHMT